MPPDVKLLVHLGVLGKDGSHPYIRGIDFLHKLKCGGIWRMGAEVNHDLRVLNIWSVVGDQ